MLKIERFHIYNLVIYLNARRYIYLSIFFSTIGKAIFWRYPKVKRYRVIKGIPSWIFKTEKRSLINGRTSNILWYLSNINKFSVAKVEKSNLNMMFRERENINRLQQDLNFVFKRKYIPHYHRKRITFYMEMRGQRGTPQQAFVFIVPAVISRLIDR